MSFGYKGPMPSVHLENGEEYRILINGVECRFIRRDCGPNESISFQAAVRGYSAGSRGKDTIEMNFWPQDRTEPMWEIV